MTVKQKVLGNETRKKLVVERLQKEFEYTEAELLNDFEWIEVEADAGMFGNIFFDGTYVLFAEDKRIWY